MSALTVVGSVVSSVVPVTTLSETDEELEELEEFLSFGMIIYMMTTAMIIRIASRRTPMMIGTLILSTVLTFS